MGLADGGMAHDGGMGHDGGDTVLEDGGAGAGVAVKAAALSTGCAAAGGTPGLEALLLCAAMLALGRKRPRALRPRG